MHQPVIIWTMRRSGGTSFCRKVLASTRGRVTEDEPFNPNRKLGEITQLISKLRRDKNYHHILNNLFLLANIRSAEPQEMADNAMKAAKEIIEKIDFALESRERPSFKHCTDCVPEELSTLLAKRSHFLGYAHVFLYRENTTKRIISLEFARRTGIWGPKQLSKNDHILIKQALATKLNIRPLINEAAHCNNTYQLLYKYTKKLFKENHFYEF